ncbi:TAD1 [Symbiodinium sp. KB8]|nr:TAD1 [Symbiodinium sp. KB8]
MSILNTAQDREISTPAIADRIAQAVLSRYDELPGRGKPQGRSWTVLAGIVAEKPGNHLQVLALATGTRCLGVAAMTTGNGQVVHDCHAEALCRRVFHRFLLADMLCAANVAAPEATAVLLKRAHAEVIGLSALDFQQVIGLSTSEFQQVIGLSTSEFQQVIGLSTSEFQQVIGLSTSVIGLSVPSTRCMCVGNPNYNGSVRLQYTAGGAGDTDESGTNKDAHQLSVIWQKDASATTSHNIFFFDVSSESLLDSDWS